MVRSAVELRARLERLDLLVAELRVQAEALVESADSFQEGLTLLREDIAGLDEAPPLAPLVAAGAVAPPGIAAARPYVDVGAVAAPPPEPEGLPDRRGRARYWIALVPNQSGEAAIYSRFEDYLRNVVAPGANTNSRQQPILDPDAVVGRASNLGEAYTIWRDHFGAHSFPVRR